MLMFILHIATVWVGDFAPCESGQVMLFHHVILIFIMIFQDVILTLINPVTTVILMLSGQVI